MLAQPTPVHFCHIVPSATCHTMSEVFSSGVLVCGIQYSTVHTIQFFERVMVGVLSCRALTLLAS